MPFPTLIKPPTTKPVDSPERRELDAIGFFEEPQSAQPQVEARVGFSATGSVTFTNRPENVKMSLGTTASAIGDQLREAARNLGSQLAEEPAAAAQAIFEIRKFLYGDAPVVSPEEKAKKALEAQYRRKWAMDFLAQQGRVEMTMTARLTEAAYNSGDREAVTAAAAGGRLTDPAKNALGYSSSAEIKVNAYTLANAIKALKMGAANKVRKAFANVRGKAAPGQVAKTGVRNDLNAEGSGFAGQDHGA